MAKFGVVPPEPPRIVSLDVLAPGFRRKLDALIADMAGDGWKPVVAETARSAERVEWLYNMGRGYDDGRGIVTNVSDPSIGWHPYFLAADIWNGELARPWELGSEFRDALGLSAKACGLTWGGDWTTKDYPHVQWAPMRNTPSKDAQALYAAGDIKKVWAIVGADQ